MSFKVCQFNIYQRVRKLAQGVKMLATRSNGVGFMPGTIWWKKEWTFANCPLIFTCEPVQMCSHYLSKRNKML